MKAQDKAHSFFGSDFEEFARGLFDGRDGAGKVIAELLRAGEYDKIAEIVACAPLNGSQAYRACGENYYESKGLSECDRRIKIFIAECESVGIAENEYIAVLIAADWKKRGGALRSWRDGADKYIKTRARDDFDRIADYVDKYDKKFRCYSALFEVSPQKAAKRLVSKLLCEKGIDKAAIRDVLMDYPYIANELIALYDGSDAKTRAEIAKLLKVYKNETAVKKFLADTVSADESKTVRSVLSPVKRYSDNGVKLFEGMMISESPIPVAMFYNLAESSASVRDAADKIFFYKKRDCGNEVLTFDDGKFFDLNDMPVELEQTDDIYVLHPLTTPAYAKDILGYGVEQPFLQIRRPIYKIKADERTFSDRFAGTIMDRDAFKKNVRRIGFEFAGKRAPTDSDELLYSAGDFAVRVRCELPAAANTAACGRISFCKAADIVRIKRSMYVRDCKSLSLCELTPVAFSELAYAVYRLFDFADS